MKVDTFVRAVPLLALMIVLAVVVAALPKASGVMVTLALCSVIILLAVMIVRSFCTFCREELWHKAMSKKMIELEDINTGLRNGTLKADEKTLERIQALIG